MESLSKENQVWCCEGQEVPQRAETPKIQSNEKVTFQEEDVNGEKLTVKKMVDFWCRFFHGLVPIFSRFDADFSRFVRDINGKKKLLVIDELFHGDRAKVPPYNGNDPPPAPGSLQALLFPPLSNNVENKGTQGVRARCSAELPPFISIVRCPGRPVILGMELWGSTRKKRKTN